MKIAIRNAVTFSSILIVALMLLQCLAFSQTVTGSLSGTVVDSSGAVVPGAQVKLTNEATGTSTTTKSNSSGYFSFSALFPGTYDITVTAKGFSTVKETGIPVAEHESRTVSEIKLPVGAEATEVTVTGEGAPVPVDSGASSTTLNNVMVSETAIQGRDAAELIRLMPGMAINSGLNNSEWSSAVTQINSGPVGAFSSNGTQPNGSMQLIMNGSVITDAGNQGTQIANVNQDMTQEVTIQNSSFSAEYAHGPVTFTAVGKQGTKDFHGELYEYTRNGSFNANNAYFNASKVPRPIDHYWYTGGNIGGPIFFPGFNKNRQRAFFFLGFEHLNQKPAGTLHKYFVPTPAMMNGDFTAATMAPYLGAFGGSGGSSAIPCADTSGFWNYSNFCQGAVDNGQVTLYDPSGNPISPAAYDASIALKQPLPVSGSRISPSLIDPNGQVLMKLLSGAPGLIPLNPNASKGYNAEYLDRAPVNGNEMNIRGDVNITDNMRAFVSFTRQTESDINNLGLWWWQPNAVPYPSQTPANQVSREWSVGVTNIIKPTLLNEATFGYAYFINPVLLANPSAADPSKVGYTVKPPFAQPVPEIPDIVSWCCTPGGGGSAQSATPSAGLGIGSFGTNPAWYGKASGKDSYTPDFSDTLSWTKGTHNMKYGFFWARYANVQTENACCGGGTIGEWDFDPWAFNSTANIYADMLLGHAAGFSQGSQNFVDNLRYNEYDFFAQDSWRVHPHVTLSYGLRVEHEGQWYPANEKQGIMVWDPNNPIQPYSKSSTNPLAGFVWHGIDSKIPLSGWQSAMAYADPRVGVAWDVLGNGKTVLRGGFGIYRFNVAYNDVTENGMLDAPLGLRSFSSNCTFNSLSDLSTCGAAGAATRNTRTVAGMLAGDNKSPYTQTWNVIIDQRAPWNSLFEIQYTGNRSRDLLLSANGGGGVHLANINYIAPGALFNPDPATGITYYCQGAASATCVAGSPQASEIPHFRPYDYAELDVFRHGSYSNYNGMVVQWIKQRGPAVFTINYTWSHALGIRDGNNDNGQGPGAAVDAFNLRNNYGTLAFNRAHIANASYVINLPSPIHGNAFAKQVVNGWQVSGVFQWQSGVPLQPLTGSGLNPSYPGGMNNQSMLGTDGILLEPILTCDPRHGVPAGGYFNPNCFVAPSVRGQNGQLIWPNITAPGFFDADLGMYKNFHITERQKIQFRLTGFNFLNHPNPQFGLGSDVNLKFGAPGGHNLTVLPGGAPNPTNGKPIYEVGNRTVELALKYIF